MKRLTTEKDLAELEARIRTLLPESRALWSRMSCPQMICHLSDSFRGILRDRKPSDPRDTLFSRTVAKWLFVRLPLSMPKHVPTSPQVDQVAGGGTPPGKFPDDTAALLKLLKRFLAQPQAERPPHAMFGPLSERDWKRLAWAHVDHHLRQFGA